MRVYYDQDADINLVKGKKVAVIGYGSQGHAHVLNMRDSGVKDLVVALRKGSATAKKAEGEGIKVMEVAEASAWADIIMMLTPDELQGDIYRDHIAANIRPGAALLFAHGLNVHFNLIEPRADIDVLMVAPRAPATPCAANISRVAACPASWRSIRTPRAMPMTSACPTPPPSAAAVRASSRPPSRKNARPISSASRSCSAVASSN